MAPLSREHRLKSRLLWLLGLRRRVRVSGNSMSPLLESGQVVFVDPGAYRHGLPRIGDVVLSAHPYRTDTRLIKSVREITAEGAVVLMGANPSESTDSRSFGPVPAGHILGRVLFRVR